MSGPCAVMGHRGASVGVIARPYLRRGRPSMACLPDNNDKVPIHQAATVKRRNGSPRKSTWADIALPISLVLLISVPVMMVEEGWHSRPMIDDGSYLWILPALLVASVFLFGGALAGFRCPSSAVAHASAVASISSAILLLGAVLRRVWIVHEGTQDAVLFLWFLGVVGALTLSVIGSLFGRRLATAGDCEAS
jgi:hypothetical protein